MKIILIIVLCTVIVTFPSACAPSEARMVDSTMVEPGYSWSPLRSFIEDGLIHCTAREDGYIFELYAHDGSFLVLQADGETQNAADLTIEGSGYAYWEYYSASAPDAVPPWKGIWRGTKTFIEVYIRQNDTYKGYAVVKVECHEDASDYIATVLECKEIRRQEAQEYGLSKEALQQMIDTAIQSNS